MASAAHVREHVRGAAVEFGAAGHDGSLTFQESVVATQPLQLSGPHDRPLQSDRPIGDLRPQDLPLRLLDAGAGSVLVQFVDLVLNVPGPINPDALTELMLHGRYKDLPDHFKLKLEPVVPYTMQLIIVPVTEDSFTVIKHVNFSTVKLSVGLIISYAVGQAMAIDYGKHFKAGTKAFNYMLDHLGGYQWRYWSVGPKGSTKVKMDPSARKKGFLFIKERGPKANNMNQFLEWTEDQVNTPESPVYWWERNIVKESLRNYSQGKMLAKTLDVYPLTLRDVAPWFLYNVLMKPLSNLNEFSIMWIGAAGVGKSPVSKIIGMTQSKYMIERDERDDLTPSIRTAKNLDFFRAEPGSVYKPDVFDDGLLQKQSPETFKAFHNPAEEDALVWARWGGSAFEMNQSRQSCANPYAKKAEPAGDETIVSHDAFVAMLAPIFHKDTEEDDIPAYLKRGHVFLFSDDWLYLRLATQNKVQVPHMPFNGDMRDLLTPECKEMYGAYRRGCKDMPENYEEDMAWSVDFLKKAIKGEAIRRPHTVTGTPLFENPVIMKQYLSKKTSSENAAVVKLAKQTSFEKRLVAKVSGLVIDLDSPLKAKRPRCAVGEAEIAGGSSSSSGPPPAQAIVLDHDAVSDHLAMVAESEASEMAHADEDEDPFGYIHDNQV